MDVTDVNPRVTSCRPSLCEYPRSLYMALAQEWPLASGLPHFGMTSRARYSVAQVLSPQGKACGLRSAFESCAPPSRVQLTHTISVVGYSGVFCACCIW